MPVASSTIRKKFFFRLSAAGGKFTQSKFSTASSLSGTAREMKFGFIGLPREASAALFRHLVQREDAGFRFGHRLRGRNGGHLLLLQHFDGAADRAALLNHDAGIADGAGQAATGAQGQLVADDK